MQIHGFHANPWIPCKSMDSMQIHGFHGVQEVIWCHSRGHIGLSKGSYGIIQEGHMGSSKRSFGVIRRVIWGHPEVIWGHPGGHLGPSRGSFGVIQGGHLGSSGGSFGVIQGVNWDHPWGHLESFRGQFYFIFWETIKKIIIVGGYFLNRLCPKWGAFFNRLLTL